MIVYYSAGITVGLEKVHYEYRENVGSVKVCAAIITPGDCTVAFPFMLVFNTSDDSAGKSVDVT